MSSFASTNKSVDASLAQAAVKTYCTYCGLPVAARSSAGDAAPATLYCCYGCRFAHAVVQEQGNEGAIRWTVIRLGLAIFFTMNLMAFTMTMWSLDVYDVEPDAFQQKLFEVFRWLSMLFALPVLLLLGVPLLQNALESWHRRVYSTDLLIGLAVIAAYVTSVVNVIRESGTIYFEVGATVLVMITLGRWIEAAGKQKATESLDKLLTLLPETVIRVGRIEPTSQMPERLPQQMTSEAAKNSEDLPSVGDAPAPQAALIRPTDDNLETSCPTTEIDVGDMLRIRAGERFPADAVIRRGNTTVDEQVFTGESQPIARTVGGHVLAGTVNLDGDILVEVTAGFQQGSFGRLLETLQEARTARGFHQRLADRVASWFFPLVTLIAAAAFAWHLPAGVGTAIQVAMSVLLIACPCALGLATPLAVWTALSTAIKHQVLFRSGEAVERLANTKAVCLDKTGTLTTGTPRVFQTAVFGEHDPDTLMPLVRQLANSSSHPFSKSVAAYVDAGWPTWDQRNNESPKHISVRPPASALPQVNAGDRVLENIRTVSGGGVEALVNGGQLVRLGSVEFSCCKLHDEEIAVGESAPDLCVACRAKVPLGTRVQLDRLRMAADQQAASIVLLSINRIPAVGFLIAEAVRPEASAALQQLTEQTQALFVLSGDRPTKGKFLRHELQVEGLNIECSLNPEQKVARVTAVRRKHGTTVMVGDGINDAPALAASDVGIAMGCGADVSRDSAQVCLLSNDLMQVPWAIDLARRTTSIIRQNLFWAFGYNTVGVCLAATGILNPAIAAGLMIASSLLVISNSLRLLRDESSIEPNTPTTPDSTSIPEDAGTDRNTNQSSELSSQILSSSGLPNTAETVAPVLSTAETIV